MVQGRKPCYEHPDLHRAAIAPREKDTITEHGSLDTMPRRRYATARTDLSASVIQYFFLSLYLQQQQL
jgi:hypothetical protein